MRILGIDPGNEGALVLVESKRVVEIVDIPTLQKTTAKPGGKKGKKTLIDESTLKSFIVGFAPDWVVIEFQQSMKRNSIQKPSSMFTLGEGYGFLKGVCMGAKIPFLVVPPKEWQGYFGVKGEDTKVKAYQVACRLFPDVADQLVGPKNGHKFGRSDALLIAMWGVSTFEK